MPALDALQAAKGGKDFEVVAVNVDTARLERRGGFLDAIGVKALARYADPSGDAFETLRRDGKALGLPVSLLIDRDGCEVAAVAGPLRKGFRRRRGPDRRAEGRIGRLGPRRGAPLWMRSTINLSGDDRREAPVGRHRFDQRVGKQREASRSATAGRSPQTSGGDRTPRRGSVVAPISASSIAAAH